MGSSLVLCTKLTHVCELQNMDGYIAMVTAYHGYRTTNRSAHNLCQLVRIQQQNLCSTEKDSYVTHKHDYKPANCSQYVPIN